MPRLRRRSKFGEHRSEGWDSQGERRRYDQLCLLEKAGEIKDLRRQVRIDLHIGRRYMRLDFVYFDNHLDEMVYEDFKGFPTPQWQVKRDIWAAGFGPGILRVSKKVAGGYEFTDYHPKPKAEALRRVLRCARATMSEIEFAEILAGEAEAADG